MRLTFAQAFLGVRMCMLDQYSWTLVMESRNPLFVKAAYVPEKDSTTLDSLIAFEPFLLMVGNDRLFFRQALRLSMSNDIIITCLGIKH